MELLLLMLLAALSGAAATALWFRHRLLAAFRADPIRTVRRLCRDAYPPDDLFD